MSLWSSLCLSPSTPVERCCRYARLTNKCLGLETYVTSLIDQTQLSCVIAGHDGLLTIVPKTISFFTLYASISGNWETKSSPLRVHIITKRQIVAGARVCCAVRALFSGVSASRQQTGEKKIGGWMDYRIWIHTAPNNPNRRTLILILEPHIHHVLSPAIIVTVPTFWLTSQSSNCRRPAVASRCNINTVLVWFAFSTTVLPILHHGPCSAAFEA